MKKHKPPGWALKFLEFFFKDRYLEQIEGDLMEIFERSGSTRKARIMFGWNTLRFFRLRYLKGLDDFEQLTTLAMIKNYLKVAIRTLVKQKSYSVINILGLAIGLASCLLITIYVNHERSYDRFHPDSEQIFRVLNGRTGGWTPPLLAENMMIEVSEIEVATRLNGTWESLFQIGDRSFIQDGAVYADQNLFRVFETPFLQGNPASALAEPNTVVLTESIARKCFPDEPALGKTIVIDEETTRVTGVVKDPPKNTHFPYKYVVSSPEPGHRNWTGNSVFTYAKTIKNPDVVRIEDKLMDFYEKHVGPEALSWSGHETFEELIAQYPDRHFGFTLLPVTDIHLHRPRYSMGKSGDYKNVVIFSIIAIFILVIACVNYINMTTARSTIRSKEVGIRKALGSYRNNIISQFLVESILITGVAIVLAIILSGASLNYFNQLTGRSFETGDIYTIQNILYTMVLLIIAGILAGFYPAWVMSGFSPLKALRGQKQQAGKAGLRSILVAFQFAISVCLIAATVVVYQQLSFMQSRELGVNIDQTLVINGARVIGDKYEVFKHELESITGIEKVGKASNIPFHGYGDWLYRIPNEETRNVSPYNGFTSAEVKDILDLEMVKGRFFMENTSSDTNHVVINESLAKELGWENPVGQQLSRSEELEFTIVGVMKDFNFTSLKQKIGPLIFRYGGIASSEVGEYHQAYILMKVSSTDLARTIDQVEKVWKKHARNYPLDSFFLDDSFQRHYEAERKFGNVFTTFSGLAIFIAFMGLFALTTFVLQKRYKEIAVRKVLGATAGSLVRMILGDFTKLILIGSFVGIAVAFYLLQTWLEGYSYRIALSWHLLSIPIVTILIFSWVVVSLKSYKAAISNPSSALKEE